METITIPLAEFLEIKELLYLATAERDRATWWVNRVIRCLAIIRDIEARK